MPTLASGHFYQAGHIQEAACMAQRPPQVRRHSSRYRFTYCGKAIQRIGALYGIDREIRGKPIELQHEIREMRTRPLVEELHPRMNKTLAKISRKSDTAGAHPIRAIALASAYTLSR